MLTCLVQFLMNIGLWNMHLFISESYTWATAQRLQASFIYSESNFWVSLFWIPACHMLKNCVYMYYVIFQIICVLFVILIETSQVLPLNFKTLLKIGKLTFCVENSSLFYNTFFLTLSWLLLKVENFILGKKRENCFKFKSFQSYLFDASLE